MHWYPGRSLRSIRLESDPLFYSRIYCCPAPLSLASSSCFHCKMTWGTNPRGQLWMIKAGEKKSKNRKWGHGFKRKGWEGGGWWVPSPRANPWFEFLNTARAKWAIRSTWLLVKLSLMCEDVSVAGRKVPVFTTNLGLDFWRWQLTVCVSLCLHVGSWGGCGCCCCSLGRDWSSTYHRDFSWKRPSVTNWRCFEMLLFLYVACSPFISWCFMLNGLAN